MSKLLAVCRSRAEKCAPLSVDTVSHSSASSGWGGGIVAGEVVVAHADVPAVIDRDRGGERLGVQVGADSPGGGPGLAAVAGADQGYLVAERSGEDGVES